MRISQGCRFVSFVAFGVAIALGGCSSGSRANDENDNDVGSPGGAFVSPHADAAGDDAFSAPEGGGDEYDAEGPRYDSAPDAYTEHDARPADAQALDTGARDAAPTGCVSNALPGDGGVFDLTLPTVVRQTGGDAGSACGAGDVTAFYEACFTTSGSSAACGVWFPGGGGTLDEQTCGACINGPNPGSGAYVENFPSEPSEAFANDVACILALDPSPAGVACAQDVVDLDACEAASCASCTNDGMGGGTDPDGSGIVPCETVAQQGACAAYAAAEDSDCTDLDPGGAAAVCYFPNGTTFESAFMAYAMVLCGGS